MVSEQSVTSQLQRLHFKTQTWGRAEVRELPKILIEGEEIYECVNGFYEGGFALLVATNFRVVLIDKKPLNYLTVEDLRFDMINEIDYSHRLMGAQITIATGSKTLRFRSYNQGRLRKLITHVQHCLAEAKQQQSQHAEGQNQHLDRINQQLQTYLLAQLQHQQELMEQLREARKQGARVDVEPEVVKPEPELADYLFAQSLLRDYQDTTGKPIAATIEPPFATQQSESTPRQDVNDLYNEGIQEVFGKHQLASPVQTETPAATVTPAASLEINPLRIAYSKLPMALRNRKFARPTPRMMSSAPLSKP